MLRKLITVFIIAIVFAACIKDNSAPVCPYKTIFSVVPSSQADALADYIDTNNITATKHPSGFYYNISKPGTGTDSMGLCSEVAINYRGKLVNDSIFDQQMANPVTFILGGLIEGFQKSLPLIKKGGEMKLYVPPALGYGPNPVKKANPQIGGDSIVVIPGNSILVFDVKLVDYTQTY